ncbi:MAG: response regulator [Candidatus Latescibacterota bacterium]
MTNTEGTVGRQQREPRHDLHYKDPHRSILKWLNPKRRPCSSSTTNAACSPSIRRLLRREGWNLLFSESAVEGMEVLRQNSVDLVVSDMRMPQIDGATFLKRVRQDSPYRAYNAHGVR